MFQHGSQQRLDQPRVVVFALGGTIAMVPNGDGVVPTLTADQLIGAVPGLAESGIAVDVVDFRTLPSAMLSFGDLAELAEALRQRLADGSIAGAVVTQGTDVIEETAYLLDLHHETDHPVVVTGAMRNPSLAGADGPANLLAAIQVAAAPHARGLGVVVAFADEIHAASAVHKVHTSSLTAFQSPNSGPIGQVVEGAVRLHARPVRRVTLPPPAPAAATATATATGSEPTVALVTTVFGDTGGLLDGLADRFDGLVLAALGGGHVPAQLVKTLAAIAARIPVVLSSRTGAGAVLTHTYGYPGSEIDLLSHNVIPAGYLDPFKARILLRQLLATGHDHHAIETTFALAGGYRNAH